MLHCENYENYNFTIYSDVQCITRKTTFRHLNQIVASFAVHVRFARS